MLFAFLEERILLKDWRQNSKSNISARLLRLPFHGLSASKYGVTSSNMRSTSSKLRKLRTTTPPAILRALTISSTVAEELSSIWTSGSGHCDDLTAPDALSMNWDSEYVLGSASRSWGVMMNWRYYVEDERKTAKKPKQAGFQSPQPGCNMCLSSIYRIWALQITVDFLLWLLCFLFRSFTVSLLTKYEQQLVWKI